ncbi:peptide MFS transporter [Paraferrimonas haliotis]|uniref:MFS transporter n=1 Tax=Paraferrimonas haliotis TaxID=2013866 RepID=A0AA37WZ70_9GAMM|nr:MFS transporter [Paraferrimonas haliotis]GLS83691.1 MFS transporter [Paraferrimonas haliotis]
MWNTLNRSMMFVQAMFGLAFYGVMVILTRFFLEKLNYSEADTMMVVGAFSSIGPLFSIAGGFIADRFLGAYRSLTISNASFAVGYALLVFGASIASVPMSLGGIALVSYARGLMSPNFPGLFKRTFAKASDFENAFPINYSVNNVGALLGQYLYPMFVLYIGFNGGFALSAAMAGLAFLTLILNQKRFISVSLEIDKTPVSAGNWVKFLALSAAMIGLVFFMFSDMEMGKNIVYVIGGAAILYFTWLMIKAEKSEALRMGTILIMTFLTVCFFVYYGQMMTSMNMVAINTLQGDLFGVIPLEPEAAQAMNPLWCAVAGPIIAVVFQALEKRGVNFTTATKIGFSFIFTAIAFGILTFAVHNVGEDVIIRPEVFLAVHFFQAFAEVIVGSLVVAFILSVAPKRIESFSVSLFSVAMAVSGIIGAVISTTIALEKGQQVTQHIVQTVYGDFFQMLTTLAVVMVAVAFISSFVVKKMLAAAEKAQPTTDDIKA